MAFSDDNTADNVSVAGFNEALGKLAKDPGLVFAATHGISGSRHHDKKERERFRDALLNGTMWDSSPFGRAFTLAPPSPPVANDESQVWGICNKLNTQRAIKIGDMVAVATAAGAVIYLARRHFELTFDNDNDLEQAFEAA